MNQDLFPVFNPQTSSFLFHKKRGEVHRDGDWHTAIQANIIRKNNKGTYEILVQERSSNVDISGDKFDQSLATQMCWEDDLSSSDTLKRGLWQELGITKYNFVKIPHKMFIVKTYNDQTEMLNRELLNLYIVRLSDKQTATICTPKIKNLYWMEWKEFVNFFDNNKNKFTKTGQFYFSNKNLLSDIESIQYNFLYNDIEPIENDKCIFHINDSKNQESTYNFEITALKKYKYLFEIK